MEKIRIFSILLIYLAISSECQKFQTFRRFKVSKNRIQNKKTKKSSTQRHLGTKAASRDFYQAISEFASKALNVVIAFKNGVINILPFIINNVAKDLKAVFDKTKEKHWFLNIINGILNEFSMELDSPSKCLEKYPSFTEIEGYGVEIESEIDGNLESGKSNLDESKIQTQNDFIHYGDCMTEIFLETHNEYAQIKNFAELQIKLTSNGLFTKELSEIANEDDKKKLFESIVIKSRQIMIYYNEKIQNSSFSTKTEEWVAAFSSIVLDDNAEGANKINSFKFMGEEFIKAHEIDCKFENESGAQPLSLENSKCESNKINRKMRFFEKVKNKNSFKTVNNLNIHVSRKKNSNLLRLLKLKKEKRFFLQKGKGENDDDENFETGEERKDGVAQEVYKSISKMKPMNLSQLKNKYILQCNIFVRNDLENLKNNKPLYFKELLELYASSKTGGSTIWTEIKSIATKLANKLKGILKKLWMFLKYFFKNCISFTGDLSFKNVITGDIDQKTQEQKDMDTKTLNEFILYRGLDRGIELVTESDVPTILLSMDTAIWGGVDIVYILMSFFRLYYEKKKLLKTGETVFYSKTRLAGTCLSYIFKTLIGMVIPLSFLNVIITQAGNEFRIKEAFDSLSAEEKEKVKSLTN